MIYPFTLWASVVLKLMLRYASNSEERVHIIDEANMLRVIIIDLKETDSGNYTCSLKPDLKAPIKKSVTVIILPRESIHALAAAFGLFCLMLLILLYNFVLMLILKYKPLR